MTYGLQVLNADGDLVIDGAFRNHAVVATGSGSTANNRWVAFFDNVGKVTLSQPIDMNRSPLIWARTSVNHWLGLIGLEVNAANQLTGFWVGAPDPQAPGNFPSGYTQGATPFDWRVTAVPQETSQASWGMQVFDAEGRIGFDSALQYLDIVAVDSPADISYGRTFTHPAVSGAFSCLSSSCALYTASSAGDDTLWYAAMTKRVSDSVIRVEHIPYAYEAGSIAYINIGSAFALRSLMVAAP